MARTCEHRRLKSLPLTKENLMVFNDHQAKQPPPKKRVYSSLGHSTVSSWRKHCRQDVVLESPHISPFPYHNDSLFLPLAEHTPPLSHPSSNKSSTSGSQSSSSTLSRSGCGSHTSLWHNSSHVELKQIKQEPATNLPRRAASAPPLMDRKRHRSLPSKMASFHIGKLLKRLFHATIPKRNSKKATSSPIDTSSTVWYSQYTANPAPPAGLAVATVA
ncbi:uncharacterized protein BYT42DRAFT_586052 [Radiomyces spectabilis]|uniref:uncharacterized protein n=1 Tax=Radiomyces spectabilis TaxID=64574 RepID=UPI00222099B3|nr:uncharacterized protein BYT42DRAFT_586052 [Radiomyces spectabilis]KAI8368291.1 hypothetical protein BYT42DRAFT_586052 [Radiomyces spectabilis]